MVGDATLLQSGQTGAEAIESARSDVVSRLCSSCDSRTRVGASERHKLAERMSDRRRVRLGTRLITQ
jgi:positive regulator of sigma E activity